MRLQWLRLVLIPLGAAVLLFVGFASTASIRYSPNQGDYDKIKGLAEAGDIGALNEVLISAEAPSTKLVTLKFVDDVKNDSSIPNLIAMLSFDLPWYDQLDSELAPVPKEVRFSAHRILASYGSDRAGEAVYPLLESSSVFERLYAAGIVTRWGDPIGENALEQLMQHKQKRVREEAEWVLRMARNRR